LRTQLREAASIIYAAQVAVNRSEGLVICSAIMRDLLASTAFQIANSEIRHVGGQSAGQAAFDCVFWNVCDYVERKERLALEGELLARTEEAMVLRNKSVDELCSNVALSLVDQSFDKSECHRLKELARDITSSLAARTRELEESLIFREELQREAWYNQVRSIVSETVIAAACVGQAQQEAAAAKREAKAQFDAVTRQLQAALVDVQAWTQKYKQVETELGYLRQNQENIIQKRCLEQKWKVQPLLARARLYEHIP
jgi:hypothetical protein